MGRIQMIIIGMKEWCVLNLKVSQLYLKENILRRITAYKEMKDK